MLGLFKKKDPSKILKEATAAKKTGNIDEAISLLRKAYKTIPRGPFDYDIKTFLRLPLYLQEANRPEEAWDEFNNLLKKSSDEQSDYPELIPMSHSLIYDKMRLFSQREGRNTEAVKYGIFSHFSWATGLFLQKRNDEFKDCTTAETLENLVAGLLKKAKKENLTNKLSNTLKHEIKNIPNIKFDSLGKCIENVLQ